jgi:hypothetical protein
VNFHTVVTTLLLAAFTCVVGIFPVVGFVEPGNDRGMGWVMACLTLAGMFFVAGLFIWIGGTIG